jgi:hypothetical protein
MHAFAEWVSSRRHRSVAIAALLGLLSPLVGLLAPLAIPSAGVVVLADLRHGAREAFLVLASATLLLTLARTLLGGGSAIALGVSLALWLPALGVSELLRRSGSLSLCLQATVLGVCALAAALFIAGDPVGETRDAAGDDEERAGDCPPEARDRRDADGRSRAASLPQPSPGRS